jgi:hypothetical protein
MIFSKGIVNHNSVINEELTDEALKGMNPAWWYRH